MVVGGTAYVRITAVRGSVVEVMPAINEGGIGRVGACSIVVEVVAPRYGCDGAASSGEGSHVVVDSVGTG